jgi:SAM-dependent methyltransferase
MSETPPADALAKLKAFWNSRYAKAGDEFVYGTEPNAFLVRASGRIPERGNVLCLADGEGRNSVWLARQGFRVSAVDVSEEGVAKALALAQRSGVTIDAKVADVTRHDFGSGAWDAIVSIFLHLPAKPRHAVHRRVVDALRPGGVFVYEAYGPEQPGYGTGGPPESELLHPLDDVLADVAGCAIEHAFAGVRTVLEGRAHRGDGYVVQVIARK